MRTFLLLAGLALLVVATPLAAADPDPMCVAHAREGVVPLLVECFPPGSEGEEVRAWGILVWQTIHG